MKGARQKVQGEVWSDNGRFALRLQNDKPETDDGVVVLRHALVTLGPEQHIFPTFLLDDWGNEVRGSKLYDWVRENGNAFPRAEIFGHTAAGQEVQLFVRELEIYVKLPCYAFADAATPLSDGVMLQAILLPDAAMAMPVRQKRPFVDLKRPLASARVQWWQIPAALMPDAFWPYFSAETE